MNVGKEDIFGENVCMFKFVGKSGYNVRALTYCDLHTILREDLLELFQVYPDFEHSFHANLQITFSLRDVSLLYFLCFLSPFSFLHSHTLRALHPFTTRTSFLVWDEGLFRGMVLENYSDIL